MHNGSNHDFHLTIKNLIGKFENNDFNCLGKIKTIKI